MIILALKDNSIQGEMGEMTKKIYTREELEKLATENPNELALLFAQRVAGYPEASHHVSGKYLCLDNGHKIPDYLSDWTAVINAGKEAEIKWDREVIGETDDGVEECLYRGWKWKDGWSDDRYPMKCYQQPNWPDCAALIIVMIEVMQK